jgi:mRNA interferase MazF
MKRGEIWWAEPPTSAGRRPVLLLSRNEAYAVRDEVESALHFALGLGLE